MKKKCTNIVTDEDGTKKVCGFEYESSDAYCSDCGAPLKTNTKAPIESGMKKKKKKCTNVVTDEDGIKKVCGFEYESGDAYCSNCGVPLKTSTKPPIWLVLLITALFVGGTIYLGIKTSIDSNKVEIIVKPSVDTMGTVLGGGIYVKDTVVELVPCPSDGFVFDMWDDGNRDNPRWVKTVEEHKYVAIFKKAEEPFNPIKQGQGPSNAKQKEFDELSGEFERRMDVEMSFENVYPLITGDYETLQQILQMLNENPGLKAEPKSHYVECFEKRAGNAVEIIEKAIYSPLLPAQEREEMISKYRPQIDEIKQIRNSL